jgi:RNA polymerase sigma factor (sigma-70 family)
MTTNEYNSAVDLFSDSIYRFALKQLKNEMCAKDVVQETYTKVWLKHKEIAFEKVKSYLFKTAYHCIVDWVNTEKRNGDIEQIPDIPVSYTLNFDIQSRLSSAMDKLPPIQKTVVLLRDYEGYSYFEIAEITGLNETQVKVYIFRARKTLQAFIGTLEELL